MEHRHLLIHPINAEVDYETDYDLDFDVFFKPAVHIPGNYSQDYFERTIIIENIKDFDAVEYFQRLNPYDESITSRYFIPETLRSGYRGRITYSTRDKAIAAAKKYDQTPQYPNTCALVVADLLGKLRAIEKRISIYGYTKQQDQVVEFKSYNKYSSLEEFESLVVSIFSKVSSRFSTCIKSFEDYGMAFVKVSSLSEAIAAEITLCDFDPRYGKMEMSLKRNPVHVKHDLDVRLSLIGHPNEKILIKQDSMCGRNAKSVSPSVSFNTIICESCIAKATAKRECQID